MKQTAGTSRTSPLFHKAEVGVACYRVSYPMPEHSKRGYPVEGGEIEREVHRRPMCEPYAFTGPDTASAIMTWLMTHDSRSERVRRAGCPAAGVDEAGGIGVTYACREAFHFELCEDVVSGMGRTQAVG